MKDPMEEKMNGNSIDGPADIFEMINQSGSELDKSNEKNICNTPLDIIGLQRLPPLGIFRDESRRDT